MVWVIPDDILTLFPDLVRGEVGGGGAPLDGWWFWWWHVVHDVFSVWIGSQFLAQVVVVRQALC